MHKGKSQRSHSSYSIILIVCVVLNPQCSLSIWNQPLSTMQPDHYANFHPKWSPKNPDWRPNENPTEPEHFAYRTRSFRFPRVQKSVNPGRNRSGSRPVESVHRQLPAGSEWYHAEIRHGEPAAGMGKSELLVKRNRIFILQPSPLSHEDQRVLTRPG